MHNPRKIHLHPAPVRIWHWLNAAGFLLLIFTGFQIRFAERLSFLTLENAIKIHNYVGFAVIANYLLWVSYYFGTGKIKMYFPNLRTFPAQALRQAKFYGYGIFKGEPNPHAMTPENKFNALQQKAYIGLMFLFLPAQMTSGLFLYRVKSFENYIDLLGGVKIVDTIHVILFFFFVAFMVVHSYLATLGHTPLAHFKAMVTGYEEEHGGRPDLEPQAAEAGIGAASADLDIQQPEMPAAGPGLSGGPESSLEIKRVLRQVNNMEMQQKLGTIQEEAGAGFTGSCHIRQPLHREDRS